MNPLVNPVTGLPYYVELDSKFKSIWTSGQAAEWFWAAFVAIVVAFIVVQWLRARRRRHPTLRK